MARRSARTKRNAAPIKGEWDILPHGMSARPVPKCQSEIRVIIGRQQDSNLKDAGSKDATHQSEPVDINEKTQITSTLAFDPTTSTQLDVEVSGHVADKTQTYLDVTTSQNPREGTQRIKVEVVKAEVVTLRRSERLRTEVNVDENEDSGLVADLQLDNTTSKVVNKNKESLNAPSPKKFQSKIQSIQAEAIHEEAATLRRSKRFHAQTSTGRNCNAGQVADSSIGSQLNKEAISKTAGGKEDHSNVSTPQLPRGDTQSTKEAVVILRPSKRARARVNVGDEKNAGRTADLITGLLLNEEVTSTILNKRKILSDVSSSQEPRTQSTLDEIKEEVGTLRRSKRIRTQGNVDMDYNADQEPLTRTAERAQNKTDGSCEDLQVKPKRVPRKTKDNPYGLTPGRSPLPDWQAPSMAQCEEVYDILSGMHGKLEQPEIIPAPSLEVAGCGEVPFVLEALLRTLLSGAVTMGGAGKMVQAIIAEYGILQDDLAKGSIDWNKVRLSSIEHLENTIRIGGLASRKAKAIKGTLDMVYEENIKRRDAYLTEKATGVAADVYGASERTQGQKDLEILKTERNILSLDHMYGLSVDEAMREFTKFPGIGVKTAACVILFCLQRPCFAVDTHVHRFSKWLGWVPNKADEDTTFGHLEVRCPDHLKYGLHQLFIKHGTTCGRCKMITVEGTKDWEAIVCPLEHLLVRGKKTSMAQRKLPENKSRKASSEKDSSGPEFPEADETISDEDYKA